MARYHDLEWGVPTHDDHYLFEMLTLEGAQAGLSWATILNRRDGYRRAFANFDAAKVAKFDDRRLEKLLHDTGIIRNRLKIQSARTNARAFVRVQSEFGSFADYLWSWVDGKRIVNHPRTLADLPAKTELSDRISKDLKRRGFTFVGSTIVYATIQSVGLVDDHITSCPQKTKIKSMPTAPAPSLSDQLKTIPAATRPIVKAAIKTVKEIAPKAEEIPYRSREPQSKTFMWKLVRYAIGGESVIGIGTFRNHASIWFTRGRELDDESGLLEGSGKDSRLITLRSPADAERPAVKKMVRKAFELAGTGKAGS